MLFSLQVCSCRLLMIRFNNSTYDPINNCFRQEKLNQFIADILHPVKDFGFAHLEPALLKGLAGV